ncbi:MAG: hypothetical protein QNJ23_01450 [Woeseiaceae bacterium]|nr:hypothetical protein [Woeseiaceae bacterium]
MPAFDIDWRYVRRHTLLPALTALIAAAALAATAWLHGEQQASFRQVSSNQDAMHQDYDALVYRRRLVDRYHRRYEQFYDIGFVGVESRLEWVETLRETSVDLLLPRVSYAIEPQLQVVAPVESIRAGEDISIRVSRLHLEAGLTHELDLLRFFDELQRSAPGLIKVDRCALTWQAETAANLAAGANLLADCAINIYSVVTSDVISPGAES